MVALYDNKSHPLLFAAVNVALERGGITRRSPKLSGGSLTLPMLDTAEKYLEILQRADVDVVKAVHAFLDELPVTPFPVKEIAAMMPNGYHPAADVVLLLHSAFEGDM